MLAKVRATRTSRLDRAPRDRATRSSRPDRAARDGATRSSRMDMVTKTEQQGQAGWTW
jgi:hypothetical protein